MSKLKVSSCPNCNTPLYVRIPTCPNCHYVFYELKPEYGVEIVYDFLTAPFQTMEKYGNAIQFKSLFIFPLFSAILLFLFFNIDLILNAPVPELIPWGRFSILFFEFIIGGILWYFCVITSTSIGLNLWNRPLSLQQISQILNTAIIGFFYGMILALTFRILNIQSVTFRGSSEDIMIDGLAYFFGISGLLWMTILLYKGFSFLTEQNGIKLFFISLFPFLLVFFFILLTIGLFALGVLFG